MPGTQKNILFTLLVCLLSVTPTVAQDFMLTGVLMELGNNSRVVGAQLYNKRTTYTASSNSLGIFEIKATLGDTIQIYNRDYTDSTIVVSSAANLVIKLRRSQTLREVNINLVTKKQELTDMKQEYRNKGAFYSGKPPVLSFLFKPLTALYETFGRTPKNARRFGRYYENEMQQTLIDGFFNETIIKENTDLKNEELENFMINYRPEYEKAQYWARYDAIKYIREAYKTYKATLKK
ncbi:MAG: hypothetical protein WKF66_01180 [Pedobacter sp.]